MESNGLATTFVGNERALSDPPDADIAKDSCSAPLAF